jgi:hypothetical protein
MEKLLQNIVKKFIKQIDFSKIKLKNVENGHADEIDPSTAEGNDYHVYQIKYGVLTIGTVVTITNRIEGTKYVSNIDIIAPFRSRGIGSYVLKHWFSGHYIMADNTRAGSLYARLGKVYNKFTHREFEEFVKLAGLRGVYKLDSKGARTMKRTDHAIRRHHKDDIIAKVVSGILSHLIVNGLATAIGKLLQKAKKARSDEEYERQWIEEIRSGRFTEQKYVSEFVYRINRTIDQFYLAGGLDRYFEKHGILPSGEAAYIKKIKSDILKCKTIAQLSDYLESNTPFHPSFFEDLEYVDGLFKKARIMRDSKALVTHDSMPWVKKRRGR